MSGWLQDVGYASRFHCFALSSAIAKMVNEFRRQIIYGKLFNPHPLYILAIAKE